jgi:hypothetical protein
VRLTVNRDRLSISLNIFYVCKTLNRYKASLITTKRLDRFYGVLPVLKEFLVVLESYLSLKTVKNALKQGEPL